MSKPMWFLKVRRYANNDKWASVWLCCRDGAAESGLLHGEVVISTIQAIANATRLSIEEEKSPIEASQLRLNNECVTVAKQQELFGVSDNDSEESQVSAAT